MTYWHWNGYGFRAMNTRIYTWLYTSTPNSTDILLDVQDTFDSMEQRLSRFIPYSELSQLNNHTGDEFIASPILFSAVQSALWAATATGGLFDPTILPDLEAAGYDRSFEKVERHQPPLNGNGTHATRLNFTHVTLKPYNRGIAKPDGLKLDLGGMGKGWTVDRVADRLLTLGAFLVNAGGDIYAYGAPPNCTTWTITLPHPPGAPTPVTTLHVANRAVATSSIIRRRWMRGNTPQHHLIDPRTGKPADTDLLTVTVIASRVAVAEVYAKVALILGAKAGLEYLEALPNVEGLLYTHEHTILHTSQFRQYSRQPEVYTPQ